MWLFQIPRYNPFMELDDVLTALADDPTEPVDIADLALAIAEDEYPDMIAGEYLSRLDSLAEEVAPRISLAVTLEDRVLALTEFLFDDEKFKGNRPQYYDARNSYLNDVLDRRLGIPITLSVLAICVGQVLLDQLVGQRASGVCDSTKPQPCADHIVVFDQVGWHLRDAMRQCRHAPATLVLRQAVLGWLAGCCHAVGNLFARDIRRSRAR